MLGFEPVVFIPKSELLIPNDPDVDSESAIIEVQDKLNDLTIGSPNAMTPICLVNFHIALGFEAHKDGAGGIVKLLARTGEIEVVPLASHYDQTGKTYMPSSTDGIVVRPDEDTLILFGDVVSPYDFKVVAGFCSTPRIAELDPAQTMLWRMGANGNIDWLLKNF